MSFPEIVIPDDVFAVLDRFDRAGIEAFCVGGCVRDALRGVTPHDWDLCTAAAPQTVLSLFSDFRCLETGIRHGTVTVLTENRPLEITTYRVDGDYADHRRPSAVTFSKSLKEDCARRDFTVNAMAYHPRYGLKDFFGGVDDLRCGVIRCVGDPAVRFGEDALRILRALRFAATLGFSVDEKTAAALHSEKHLLSLIAAERVRAEFFRLLGGIHAAEMLSSYADVCAVFLPCCTVLSEAEKQKALSGAFSVSGDPVIRCAALLSLCGLPAEEAKEQLRRLTFENRLIARICTMLSADFPPPANRPAMLRALSRYSPDGVSDILTLYTALHPDEADDVLLSSCLLSDILRKGDAYTVSMLNIDGKVLTALGFRGKEIGAVLSDLLDSVIDGTLSNTEAALTEAAQTHTLH